MNIKEFNNKKLNNNKIMKIYSLLLMQVNTVAMIRNTARIDTVVGTRTRGSCHILLDDPDRLFLSLMFPTPVGRSPCHVMSFIASPTW